MSEKMGTQQAEAVIIGAGLTGLTLAFYLQRHGIKPLILEKNAKPGGVINTIPHDGFIFETGPNTGVLSTPEIAALFEDLGDRCRLAVAGEGSKKRYIMKNGRWRAIPAGLFSAIGTPLFTLKDKFRILGEPFRKPGTDPDESVALMVRRRLGKSFLDYAVDPFISGVYAGDPSKLITRYALPKLYALEQNYGSFIRGSIMKSREQKSDAERKATREVFSARGGLGSLVNALADEIGNENIICNVNNVRVIPEGKDYRVSFRNSIGEDISLSANRVVLTTGGKNLDETFPFIDEALLRPVRELRYAKVVQVAVGYQKWDGMALDAFGGLVPGCERRDILGILFPSAIFNDRAPEKGALLSVFLGGVNNEEVYSMPDDKIAGIVLDEIGKTLRCTKKPDLLRIFRYGNAIPQYEISTGERLRSIESIQAEYPGLILAGNIRDGIGMADRVKQAKQLADKIAAQRDER